MKHRLLKISMAMCSLAALVVFLYVQNNMLTITTHTLSFNELPNSFKGYKILHLSDLHDQEFGSHQKKLVQCIEELNPDLIVFTGDMVDKRRYNEQPVLNLLKELNNRYPIYMVPGNHELSSGHWQKLQPKLAALNVKILANTATKVVQGDEYIWLVGVNDPLYRDNIARITRHLDTAMENVPQSTFTVLLSHRPELFSIYAKYNISLTFAGHAHGGQVILPLVGALFAPGQGLFPKYYQGTYQLNNSTLVVSRGLGNSLFPLRLFNRPELVLVELN